MTVASASLDRRMTVAQFLAWAEEQVDDARYELVAGIPLRPMAPTNIRHVRIRANASQALRRSVAEAGLSCRVYDAGPGIAIGLDGAGAASPSTRLADVNDKVEFYGGIASIHHYLVIEQDRRRVVYHGRGASDGLEPRIVRKGEITFDPPGILLALGALYGDTTLPTS